MPGYDGTGPRGMGPMTGGGRGYCAVPAERAAGNMPAGRFLRRGGSWFAYGRGRGGGRGWRNWYYATGMPGWQRSAYGYPAYGNAYPYPPEPTAGEEKDMLKAEAEALKQELEDIQTRIQALEKAQKEEKSGE